MLGLTHIRARMHTCACLHRGEGLSASLSTEEEEHTEASLLDKAVAQRLFPGKCQTKAEVLSGTQMSCFMKVISKN